MEASSPLEVGIAVDEGLVLVVYDDKTGLPIIPGYTVQGHPTIGFGCRLDAPGGITKDEAISIRDHRIALARSGVEGLPWFMKLDPVRQDVILEMVFQMGLSGVLEFHNMIGRLEIADFAGAAAEMLDSAWHKETPKRAEHLAEMMKSGQYPT